jgi:hypothetical protein
MRDVAYVYIGNAIIRGVVEPVYADATSKRRREQFNSHTFMVL